MVGKSLSLAVLVLALCCEVASGQATAQISGTVKDQSGAVLPGVEVTVTQTETGTARSTITNETGSYALPNLAVGPYRLEASLPGFRTYARTGIVLQVNSNPVIDPVLEVGQVTEQVEVQANANLVETRTVGIGSVIENQRILELPLNGRNVAELVVLAGAAVQTGVGGRQSMQGGVLISVAGGQSYGVSYVLDGATHNQPWDHSNMPLPFPDALQEFKVETSALTAQNGMHAAAAVNGVTKSGTNEFHGNLFEFVRNGKFNARNFFARQRDSLKRNQYGGTVGGPIMKSKLFFFGGYQGTITRSDPGDTISFVPTAAMLAGDFTAFASPACNAGRQLTLRAPYVNNRINPALLSKAAVNLAGRLPKTDDPCGKITYGVALRPDETQWLSKVDYQWSANHSVFGRYMTTKYYALPPYATTDNVLVTGVREVGGRDNKAYSLTLGDTYLINPNAVNALRFAYNRTDIHRFPKGFFSAPDLGVKNFYSYVPDYINVVVTGGFTIGEQGENEATRGTRTIQVVDDVSLVHGTHQMSFGANVARWLNTSDSGAYKQGVFLFNGMTTGSGLADLLAGRLTSVNESVATILDERQWYIGVYGQDTWKATPRLTLNYGVRWEPFLPQQLMDGRIYHFDHEAFLKGIRTTQTQYRNAGAPAGLFYPGDPGFPGKAGRDKRWLTFTPRVGLAWDVNGDGRTSIRAAYGMAYEPVEGSFHLGTVIAAPWAGRVFANSPSGGFDDPWSDFPGGNPFPPPGGLAYLPYSFFQNTKYDTRSTYVQSWSLTLQRQIGADWLVSTAYLGNQTTHLWGAQEINPGLYLTGACTISGVTYNPCATNANLDQRRRLNLERPQDGQYYGSISETDDGLTASYHGLQLGLQRRVTSGVTLNGNYTWAHCIGDPPAKTNPGIGYVDPNNRNFDRGNCEADRRHILNMSAVTETPRFANAALRALGTGWKISGLFRASAGQYLTVVSGRDNTFSGILNQRPDQVRASPYGDQSSLTSYLNPAAFRQPFAGTNGNMGRTNVVGPGTWQLDMAVSRIFQVRERQRLEFRAEAFNLTNSLRRGNPNVNILQSTFGQITTASDPRIMQFALKYVF